jgi:hypothetical protein
MCLDAGDPEINVGLGSYMGKAETIGGRRQVVTVTRHSKARVISQHFGIGIGLGLTTSRLKSFLWAKSRCRVTPNAV